MIHLASQKWRELICRCRKSACFIIGGVLARGPISAHYLGKLDLVVRAGRYRVSTREKFHSNFPTARGILWFWGPGSPVLTRWRPTDGSLHAAGSSNIKTFLGSRSRGRCLQMDKLTIWFRITTDIFLIFMNPHNIDKTTLHPPD
jgi:hypothetical protein